MTTVTAALGRPAAMVLVEGEAGIGKTRLLREALTVVGDDKTVLVAACAALPEPFPMGAIVDGIRRLRPDVAGLGLSPLGGALRQLFPEWADRLPPPPEPLDDPREVRHRLLRALTELVERLAVDVLVVEDAHWADRATLEWLLMLAADGLGDDRRGLSMVVSYRPTDVPEESLLLRLTSRPPAGMEQVRILLEPLDVGQTRRLVGSMFGSGEVSERFARFLHERTDGVPLVVEECVRLLRDRHDIVRHEGRWTRRVLDELEVPPTVRDSVRERVARLVPEARRVLEAGAVLAAPADEALLAEVAELSDEAGREGVAAALASGLLQEAAPGRYEFRHVLDAQAVGEAIPASQWRRLHGRAARALRRLDPEPVVRLSRHCREAGETEAWCGYAEASAELALESGDDRSAVTVLLQLLTSIEHPIERRARLARKLGEAAFFGVAALGDLADQVADVLRQVLEDPRLPQPDQGELRMLTGRMLRRAGRLRAAFAEYEASIADLGHRPDLACLVMCNLALPSVPDWPAARHLQWLKRATDLVDQAGSSLVNVAFTTTRATVLLLLGEDAGWQAAATLRQSVAGRREQRALARGLSNVAEASLVWGRYEDTRRQLKVAADYIQEIGYRRLVDSVRVTEAHLAWYTGAWKGLGEAMSELAASDDTERYDQLPARQILGLLELVAGARAAAEHNLREIADEYTRLGDVEPMAVLPPAALGRLCLADNAPQDALRWTAPAVEMIAYKGVWLCAADIAPVHVDALIKAGRKTEAGRFVAEFAAGLDGRQAPAPAAALTVCRALVVESRGDRDGAAALFGEAAAAWAALPRPYDELLALEGQGRCLLAAGEQEQALAVLADAQTRMQEMGARWDADRVAHLLRQHGVEVARVWRRGPRGYGGELSPRELEVVALVAQGMTNSDVGEVLFLSPRTVGRHLSTAMRKLGVSTRTAAAMAAVDAGLIPADDRTSTHVTRSAE